MTDDDPSTTGGEPPLPDPQQDSVIDPASALEGLDAAALLAQAVSSGPAPTPMGRWMPPPLEEISGLLTGYQITALLGRGGMGAVYRGLQISLDREVAIKLLPPELGIDPEFEARFKREARSMAKLNHSNIVQIYDFGQTTAGHYYFVMEYVDGCDLHQLIRDGLLDVEGALNAVSQICDALQYAHDMGFVHRDIKPANIFINQQGILKVGDFGLAKLVGGDDAGHDNDLAGLTGSGIALGTMHYIAPEQLAEGMVDRRADIYSLGVMFYQMLTRELPRGAVKEPSKRVAMLDVRIDGVVFKAMDPDPDDRYQSAADLRTDVDRIRTTAPEPGPGPESKDATRAESASRKDHARSRRRILVRAPEAPPQASSRRRKSLAKTVTVLFFLTIISGLAWWLPKQFQETPGLVDNAALVAPNGLDRLIDTRTGATASGEGTVASSVAVRSPLSTGTANSPNNLVTNSLGMVFLPVPISDTAWSLTASLLFSKWETRRQDYDPFAKETGLSISVAPAGVTPLHPVGRVSWEDAMAYCDWLTKRERKLGAIGPGDFYRLPSDAEWSCAIGLTTPAFKASGISPNTYYPWGTEWPPPSGSGNYSGQEIGDQKMWPNQEAIPGFEDGFPLTSPVGSFPANQFGLYDLGGNVYEWTIDSRTGVNKDRILRGGSFASWSRGPIYCLEKRVYDRTRREVDTGFRVVLIRSPDASGTPSPVVSAGGHRYQYQPGIMTWEEAKAKAGSLGGHLATITSAEEQEIVATLCQEPLQIGNAMAWLGGIQKSPGPKGWEWITGEPFEYIAWHENSGSLTTAGSVLTMIKGGALRWNDWEEFRAHEMNRWVYLRGFVVEWDDSTGAVPSGYPSEKMTASPLPANAKQPQVTITATKEKPYGNSLGMKFVPVPGTKVLFCIHETRMQDYAAYAALHPVDDSWIKGNFNNKPISSDPSHPAVAMTRDEANGFCLWLTEKEIARGSLTDGMRYRLPTDEEWNWAVGLGDDEGVIKDERNRNNQVDFPWGSTFPPAKPAGNYGPGPWGDDGYESTARVGSFPPNQLGIHDMGGNVWELCQELVAKDDRSMIRGASWLDSRSDLMLSSFRNFCGKNTRNSNLGFRCVLDHSTSTETSVPVSPTPLAQPAAASLAGWIDLLALVDPEKDTLSGKWTLVSGGLHGEKLPDGMGAQHLQLPYEVPEEYDFRMTLTHLEGNCEATQILCGGDRQFIWGTACGKPEKWAGFNMINGKPMMQNGAGVKLPGPREVNRRYESLVEVRRDRVTGYVDGQKLVERKTDYRDMTPDPAYIMSNPKALGVGIWWSKTVFHEIAVREVTGKGKVLRSAAPPQASDTTTSATNNALFVNSLGMKFVPVPGTSILMCIHETRKGDYRTYASVNPAVNGDWLNPSRDGVPVSAADGHPVCNVSWEDSKAFCDWLSKKEGRNYRLPTDHEWSMAVGIGGREDASLTPASLTDKFPGEYIWGTEWPPPKGAGNFADTATKEVLPAIKIIEGYTDGFGTTAPVMSFAPNKLGLYDLAGNVWEYNDDYYNKAQDIRTVRGGCWSDGGLAGIRPFLASGRNGDNPEIRGATRGFRCALVMNAGPAPATAASTSPINAQPFFLGRWYQTFDGRATPYYITDFTPDGKVTAFTTEGKRSTAKWQVTAVTLRIEWDNGVNYVIPLPTGGDQHVLAGNAIKPGEVAPSSTVQLTRELPSESGAEENEAADGFVSLFQKNSTEGWIVEGGGEMSIKDGVVTLKKSTNRSARARYTKGTFHDFHLRIEFQITKPGGNSGIDLRSGSYQIDVSDAPLGMESSGAIMHIQPPTSLPQKSGWNELDVEVRGQRYLVKLNGVPVNDFTGNSATSGHIYLQIFRPDGVEFRNLRVKKL